MRSNIFKEARLSLYILSAIITCATVFYFFASMFTSMGLEGYRKAFNANSVQELDDITIIIDAGHGGEDPGATANGLIEKDINLDVALKLEAILKASGYKTVMTRSEDVLLYNQGEESRKKFYDLRNREAIAESYDNAVFVSIHMNKFPASYCRGLQTFYSENNQGSRNLAELIQESARILQSDNKRSVKSGNETIYLMENLDMPAVLVECGFLSNSEEAALLSDSNYKNALAVSIYCSIAEFLENYQ